MGALACPQGVELEAKREVWPALLGVLPPWLGTTQRQELRAYLRHCYGAQLGLCKVRTPQTTQSRPQAQDLWSFHIQTV